MGLVFRLHIAFSEHIPFRRLNRRVYRSDEPCEGQRMMRLLGPSTRRIYCESRQEHSDHVPEPQVPQHSRGARNGPRQECEMLELRHAVQDPVAGAPAFAGRKALTKRYGGVGVSGRRSVQLRYPEALTPRYSFPSLHQPTKIDHGQNGCQNRQRHPGLQIFDKSHLYSMRLALLGDDQIRNRSQQREIPRKC